MNAGTLALILCGVIALCLIAAMGLTLRALKAMVRTMAELKHELENQKFGIQLAMRQIDELRGARPEEARYKFRAP